MAKLKLNTRRYVRRWKLSRQRVARDEQDRMRWWTRPYVERDAERQD